MRLTTKSIGNHICLARMIVHLEIIIFNQLNPSSLTHIQLGLGEDIFEAFMVSIDIANIAQQIMSPDF
jgi:hypothetical protein